MDYEKKIIDEFVVESKEHLHAIEGYLLELKKQGENAGTEVINTVFSALHTIKVGSGFLDLEKINNLAHNIETMLALIRSKEMKPNKKIIDALLIGIDLLQCLLDDVRDEANIDISSVIKELQKIISNGVFEEVQRELKQKIPLYDPLGNTAFFTINEFIKKQILANGKKIFLLKYNLNEMARKKSRKPLEIIQELMNVGEILDGNLNTPLEDISKTTLDAPLFYEVLYTSEVERQILEVVLDLASELLVELSYSPATTHFLSLQTPVAPPSLQEEKQQNHMALKDSLISSAQTTKETESSIRIHTDLLDRLMNLAGGQPYALPQINLVELVSLSDEEILNAIEIVEDREFYRLGNCLLPLVRLSEVLAQPHTFSKTEHSKITERYRSIRETLLKQQNSTTPGYDKDIQFHEVLNFALLKVGSQRFGLIVDDILGTEEIVVKPIHTVTHSLKCCSGSTVIGDGRVAMIHDVEGIANCIGILDEPILADGFNEKGESIGIEGEKQKFLIFNNGPNQQFAISLDEIKRIEVIELTNIQTVEKKEFITIDNISTSVIRLSDYLQVSPPFEKKYMFLIMPKNQTRPVGILASQLVDTVEMQVLLNMGSDLEDGIIGTTVVRDKMTLLIDANGITERGC